MNDVFLSIRDLTKHYPVSRGLLGTQRAMVHALDGVDLDVARGETMGLVGESGCGKSTLARLALRLEHPTSGSISVEGTDIWNAPGSFLQTYPATMQMVFQDPFSSLNPRRTIGATITEPLKIHGMGKDEREKRLHELLDWVGLRPGQAKRYPHEFSGGQRQRVAIARALALSPDCVVCDEPVSALDVSIQAQVLNLLTELQDRLNLTYLFISHDLAVVSHISDRVAVMYLGRLVELSPAADLYDKPLHPYTQALLKAIPIPDPDGPGIQLHVQGDPPSPINPPQGCRFHPRCPQAMPQCATTVPQWKQTRDGHFVACHLY